MRFFRMYRLDRVGSIVDTRLVQAADDAEALRQAKSLSRGSDFEVWDLTRLVGQTWSGAEADPASVSAAVIAHTMTGSVPSHAG